MVHGNFAGELRRLFEYLLVPNLTLTSGVGENEHGLVLVYGLDNLIDQMNAQVSAPRKSIHGLWNKRDDLNGFIYVGANADPFLVLCTPS